MKKLILTFACSMAFVTCGQAQQSIVHENIVSPSKTDAYLAAVMKIKEACAANKVKMAWRTVAFDDNTFGHVLPVEGTASLETDLWTDLKSKIGQEAFDKLVAALHANVEGQIQAMLSFMPDLSYLEPNAEDNFRRFVYLFPLPGKEKEMEDILMEWKKTYEMHKAAENFNVYRMVYAKEPGYVVSFAAKSALDHETKRQKSEDVFGDAAAKLWKRTMSITKKYFSKRGRIIAQFGYEYAGS